MANFLVNVLSFGNGGKNGTLEISGGAVESGSGFYIGWSLKIDTTDTVAMVPATINQTIKDAAIAEAAKVGRTKGVGDTVTLFGGVS